MPMTINFVDASEGLIETYGWDFGDGDTSILEDPSHTYAEPLAASYTVTHYVSGAKGMDSISKTITVPTFTVTVGLTVDMSPVPANNIISAGDLVDAPGDCGSFTVSRAVSGPWTATVQFDCADRPALVLYVRGVQAVTGLARIQAATVTIADTGGVCP